MISAIEAAKIASSHLALGEARTLTIRDGRAVRGHVYGLDFDDMWVAILEPAQISILESTLIVAVSKLTGKVVYEGPAMDEG